MTQDRVVIFLRRDFRRKLINLHHDTIINNTTCTINQTTHKVNSQNKAIQKLLPSNHI